MNISEMQKICESIEFVDGRYSFTAQEMVDWTDVFNPQRIAAMIGVIDCAYDVASYLHSKGDAFGVAKDLFDDLRQAINNLDGMK